MKTSGWIFMIVSWAIIVGTLAYTLMRTLRTKNDRQP